MPVAEEKMISTTEICLLLLVLMRAKRCGFKTRSGNYELIETGKDIKLSDRNDLILIFVIFGRHCRIRFSHLVKLEGYVRYPLYVHRFF